MNSTYDWFIGISVRRSPKAWVTLLILYASSGLTFGQLRVVTTTSDLAALAREIVGDQRQVRSICTGREDPHVIQGKPSFIVAARDADLWIRVGLDLEAGWESVVLEGSRNPKIQIGQLGHLDAGALIEPLDVPVGPVSREMGDIHPLGNPHYWVDPWNARVVARGIAARLAQLDPKRAAMYHANVRRFEAELDVRMFGEEAVRLTSGDALWDAARAGTLTDRVSPNGSALGGWWGRMWPLRGTSLVTYHRSWTYFATRFGLKIVGELEPKPGIPPSGSWLEQLAQKAKSAGVRWILQEPWYNPKAARWLADRTGASVVIVPISVGGDPVATNYFSCIDMIVDRLVSAGLNPVMVPSR